MKNVYPLLLSIIISLNLPAQNNSIPVRFNNGNFITGSNIIKQTFKQSEILSALFSGKYYVLVQFTELPAKGRLEQLKTAGIELTEYFPGNAYLATIDKDFDFKKAASFRIGSVNMVPTFVKVDKNIFTTNFNDKENEKFLAVNIFPGMDKKLAAQELMRLKAVIVPTKFSLAPVIFIQADSKIIDSIAALPFVSYINVQSIKDRILNYNNHGTHSINSLQSAVGRSLDGRGVAVGVGDNADISTHLDFTGRLINRVFYVPEYHGTHTSGTVAGAGLIDPKAKGMAPKAPLISQWFSDIITNTASYVTDYNLIATNNSYYSSEPGCAGNSLYDVMSNYADAQVRTYNQVLHVIASGNDGNFSCSPYPYAYATIKSGWQTAKNVITVGNLVGADYNISFNSSHGPVKDGRIKPEIVANGTNTYSNYINNGYGPYSGSSMAAPVVTGTLSLLQQRYRQLHSGANGSSALMKAVLCNGAEDLGNAGPDYTFGFGMMNARNAVEALESNRYYTNAITNAASITQNISVPAGARRLKVMLCWIDKEAAANAAISLVNDLDLAVTTPASAVRRPLVLNSAPSNVSDNAVERRDSLNNIEQVIIDNPTAGSYTLSVNGYAVPFGPQDYALTYQIDMNSVTVEYPFGGETFVPGETENIRWTGYGNESNNYTVEYSPDGGTNWLTKDTVPAASRTFAWTVPNTATTNGLIRVSRLGTAFSDVNNYPFISLGQPNINTTVPCTGYGEITWPAVTSATSYDIYQQKGDSMSIIGNTTGTSFLVSGLEKSKKEWLAVAARIGVVSGRRSIAQYVIANSGSCSLATFNNDLIVDTILQPNTGRQGTASSSLPVTAIKIRIKNNGTVTANGPFSVNFATCFGTPCVGGFGTYTAETINTSIAAGASMDYTFTGSFSMPAGGFRVNLKAWVTHTSDAHHDNDTAYKIVKSLNNDPVSLPYSENFESFADRTYTDTEMGLWGNDHYDFAAGSTRSRLRTFVNTGFAHSGTKAITLDQVPFGATAGDSLILSLKPLVSAQARMEFYYKNHGQANLPGNKVWMRAAPEDTWTLAYDLYANQADINQWRLAKINVNDIVPNISAATTFQVKFGQEGITSANSALQEQDYDDGYTFDDISIVEAQNDIALQQIISPNKSGCGLSASTPITVSIKNYSASAVSNVQVSYRINAGSVVTETIPSIAALATIQHTFSTPANLAAFTDYNFDFWLNAAADTYKGNDSLFAYSFHNSPVISTYPYLEGFENNDGNWYTKGNNNSWQYGTPAKAIITKAANGTKAWVTGLTGNYKNNESSFLYSPCFDLSSLTQPVLSFSHIFYTEQDYDYNWVDYSTDGGISWQKLGATSGATNWYDDAGAQRWNVSQPKWHVASVNVPPIAGTVRFRFVMFADGGVTFEGVGIDDIHVFEKQSIYAGAPVSSGLSQTVNSNSWINFNDPSGKRIASVHSHGQNLGVTQVQVYPYAGPQRTNNNQYYADRNIVIKPATQPTGNVSVRFYFTDAEAKNITTAAGCALCVRPDDPYELGVTKYSGTTADENDNVEDDQPDQFKFILPDSVMIIPYDNGYYAEFNVSSFSEFWLSKGILGGGTNCAGNPVNFIAASGGTTYQWQEDSGSGFVNIADGINYSGTNTIILQLINPATASTGYKYRCLVNGVPDAARTLRFKMTWNGSASNDWMNPANWSCNLLPDQNTDVIIPGTLINYPRLNTNASVRSVATQTGVNIIIAAGAILTVTGH